MTLSEAKLILETDGNDLEEIQDRYETSVFQQIQIFLKDPVLPSLIDSRLKKLQDTYSAFSFLAKEKQFTRIEIPVLVDLSIFDKWKDLFHAYESNKAILRRNISLCYNYSDLEQLLNLLSENERLFAVKLSNAFLQVKLQNEVKLSEQVPIVEILKDCESLMNRDLIDESIISFSKIQENYITFSLSKEVNRLRKVLKTVSRTL